MTIRKASPIAVVAAVALATVAATPARSADPTCHLLGATLVELFDASETAGDAIASQPGGLVRTGRGVIALDATRLVGDAVVLGRDATVYDVEANDVEQGRQAEVRGEVRPVLLPVLDPACAIPAVECGGDPVSVRRKKTLNLAPGRYGPVVVGNGATLRLASGTYEFCDLRVGRKGAVAASGAVAIGVAGDVSVGPGGTIRSASDEDQVVVNASGRKVSASRRATVTAALAAPEADLILGPAVVLRGRACGRTVRLGKGARLSCANAPSSTTSTTIAPTTTSSVTSPSTTTSTSTSSTSTTSPSTSTTSTTATTPSTTPTSTTTLATTTTSTSVPQATTSTLVLPTSTSSSLPSTTSTSVATSTTTSTIIPPLCGNGAVDAGESCDDGNDGDNDACPANCQIATCTPVAGTQRTVTVSFTPPAGSVVAAMTLLVNYPEGQVTIPGTGAISATYFVPLHPPSEVFIRGFDLDHAMRGVVADSEAVQPGDIFQLHFQDCAGAAPPLPGALSCVVLDASDDFTNPVTGVTCDASLP